MKIAQRRLRSLVNDGILKSEKKEGASSNIKSTAGQGFILVPFFIKKTGGINPPVGWLPSWVKHIIQPFAQETSDHLSRDSEKERSNVEHNKSTPLPLLGVPTPEVGVDGNRFIIHGA